MYIKVLNDGQKNVSVTVECNIERHNQLSLGKSSYSGDVHVAFPETLILPIVFQLKCIRLRQHRSDLIQNEPVAIDALELTGEWKKSS